MKLVCKDCGTFAEPVRETKGTIFIEIVLWLCFLVPGLIYSIWRLSSRYDACPACGGTSLLPPDTPVAARLLGSERQAETAVSEIVRPSPKAVAFGRSLGRLFAKKGRG